MAYVLEVDWDGDGDWGDTGEDISAYVLDVETLTGRNYASMLTGKATAGRLRAVLLNSDNRFSPFNTSGDLYGMLKPGRLARFRWEAEVLWIGRVTTILPYATTGTINKATLEAEGIFSELANMRIPPLATGTGDPTGTLIAAALTAAGIEDDGIETGDVTTGPFGSTATEVDLLTECRKLEDVEFGFFHESQEEYKPLFHKRTHRAALTTSQATFTDDPSGTLRYQSLVEADWTKQIFNRCIAGVSPFTLGTEQVLMTIPGPYVLAPGGTMALTASYAGPLISWSYHSRDVSESNITPTTSAPTEDTTLGPNHTFDLGPTFDAGDLIIVIVANEGDSASAVTPIGAYSTIAVGSGTSDQPGMRAMARRADGTEDGTTSLFNTFGFSVRGVTQVYRVPAGQWHDTGTIADAFATGSVAGSGTGSTSITTPSVSMAWAPVPSLVFSVLATDAAPTLVSAPYADTEETPGVSGALSLWVSRTTTMEGSSGDSEWEISGTQEYTSVQFAIRGPAVSESTEQELTPTGSDGNFTISYVDSVGGSQQLHENIQVYGVALAEGDVLTTQADYAASQDPLEGVGVRTYRNTSNLFRNLTDADSYAELVVLYYGEARPVFEMTFKVTDANHQAQMSARRVADRITLEADNNSGFGVNGDFFIESIRHRVTRNRFPEVTWALSQAFVSDPFILDTSVLDGINLLT